MEPVGGQVWRLRDGTVRTLAGSATQVVHFAERELLLDEDPAAFRIIKGRPEQLSWRDLGEQLELRRNVGLPTERWGIARHSKLAYPLAGVPGALVGCALGLRPGRRSFLTAALAEGFAVVIGFWALLAVLKAAAMAGLIPPAAAAGGPLLLLAAGAFAAARVATR
jgi:lipopolysaccharide export system permease protein